MDHAIDAGSDEVAIPPIGGDATPRDWFADVLAFYAAMGIPNGSIPAIPNHDLLQLRADLVWEEWAEFNAAIESESLPDIADGAVDLIYVTLGLLAACGVDPRPVWDAVQAANLAKAGGPRRADGKVMKPPGWKHPDIAAILAAQRPLEAR